MSDHKGDFLASAVVMDKFTTVNASGVPTTLGNSPSVVVYKADSTVGITTGATLTVDFDAVTGLNHWGIDLGAATNYTVGADYQVIIAAGTVSGVSMIGYTVGGFSIVNRNHQPTAGVTVTTMSTGVTVTSMSTGVTVTSMSTGVTVTSMGVAVTVTSLVTGATVTVGTMATGVTVTSMGTAVTVTSLVTGATVTVGTMATGVTVTSMGTPVTVAEMSTGVTVTAMAVNVTATTILQNVTVAAMPLNVTVGAMAVGVTVTSMGVAVSVTSMGTGVTVTSMGTGVTVTAMGTGVTVTSMGSGVTVTSMGVGVTVTDYASVAMAEVTSIPAATAPAHIKLGALFAIAFNKQEQTSTTRTIYESNATTVLATSTVSDDGTTFTRSALATGA